MDFVYLGTVIAYFALTWGIMKMCEILQEQKPGDKS